RRAARLPQRVPRAQQRARGADPARLHDVAAARVTAMRILVHHRTEYRYTQPLMQSVQYVRLTPRSGTSQTVNRWKVACPGADLTEWTDHYGNVCHTLVMARPTQSMVIEVSGDVRTVDTNGVIPGGTTTLPFEVFLRHTAYTQPDRALAKFAQQFKEPI